MDAEQQGLADALTASSHAEEVREDAEGRTDKDATGDAQEGRQFGKMTPSEAARRRWEKHRARQADAEDVSVQEHEEEAVLVRVSVQTGAIIKRLAKDAKQGDVQAARELRAWLSEVAQDSETSVSALDRRTRQALLARLLAEIDEDERVGADE